MIILLSLLAVAPISYLLTAVVTAIEGSELFTIISELSCSRISNNKGMISGCCQIMVHGFVEHGMHERDSNIHESIGKGERSVDGRRRKRIGGTEVTLYKTFRLTFPPFICCLLTFGAEAAARGAEVLVFLASFSFFTVLALAIAACLASVRAAAVWFRRAVIAAKSAPTIPRWCLTVLRERFLATSSVNPFLCMWR